MGVRGVNITLPSLASWNNEKENKAKLNICENF